MSTLVLHPKTATQLMAAAKSPAGSIIFQGPRGLGKATAAKFLAKQLNCLAPAENGEPVRCANCIQIEAGNFADFIWIDRGDKASLGIEQVRGLTAVLGMRPYLAGATRVVVIDEADRLTLEAQNALLKLLEEPPPATLIILTAEHLQALLITVRSRCRTVQFLRPGDAAVAAYLTATHGVPGPAAAQLAAASAGAPGTAVSLAQHPAEAEALLSLTKDVASAQSSGLFARLILSARLISSGADLERFGEALHRQIVTQLQSAEITSVTAAVWLDALERFRLQLRAKVSARVALERLMVETA